jgi:hypothetical protein
MQATVDRHDAAASGPIERLTMVVALSALLSTGWRCWRDVHQRRMAERPAAKPEKLQVWEDEGGQNQMLDAPNDRG